MLSRISHKWVARFHLSFDRTSHVAQIWKGLANRIMYSRVYASLYVFMALLSIITIYLVGCLSNQGNSVSESYADVGSSISCSDKASTEKWWEVANKHFHPKSLTPFGSLAQSIRAFCCL